MAFTAADINSACPTIRQPQTNDGSRQAPGAVVANRWCYELTFTSVEPMAFVPSPYSTRPR